MAVRQDIQVSSPHEKGRALPVFYRMGYFISGHPWKFIAGAVLLLVVAGLLIPQFLKSMTIAGFQVTGSESQKAAELLEQRFARPFNEQDLVVFHSDSLTVKDPAYRQVIEQTTGKIKSYAGVVAVIGPLDPEAQQQVSADGKAAFALVGINGSEDDRLTLAGQLTKGVSALNTAEVQAYLTGYSPATSDLDDQEIQDLENAELLGLPLALVVLALAFGSLAAALIPIPLAMIGIVLTFGLLGAISLASGNFNLVIQNMASMIGLGVGIDYTLFIVTRFREELSRGESVREAVGEAIATAGKTVFFSGSTVLIALSGLLLVNSKAFIDLAIGSMLVVGVMIVVALGLLPALLGLLGSRVNRWKIPFLRPTATQDYEHGFWASWARMVMRRPFLWITVVTLLLLLAAAPVLQLKLGTDLGMEALADRPAGKGLNILGQYFSKGAFSPVQVVVENPSGPLGDRELDSIARLTAALKNDPGVERVESITGLLDQYAGGHTRANLDAAATQPQTGDFLNYYVNLKRGGNLTVLTVIPKVAVDTPAADQLVQRIRQQYTPALPGLRVYVGGTSAEISDIATEMLQKLPWVLGLVLALSFLLLVVAFRSLFLPFKAIVMNLLSIGASYGLLVLVFQQGAGEKVFNFTSPGLIQVYLPMLAFAILFGLSMDYEVFLIGRMKEEWRRTGDNALAVERGLEHTARIITSAAAIMVAIFAAFAFTSVIEIKEMGFSLAVAILVDATLIRVLLVPAAMKVMGHWNWWLPRFLDRALPPLDL